MEGIFYDTVTVGERGQVVIPAKARRDFAIKPGDKLIVLQGMGKMGLVLVHSKHMAKLFASLTRHVGHIKKLLSGRS
ncbi:MAG: AbrB/MazE/SpoVT family DNA-binding domain-containing protein [Candidatus Margulisbacteria bacterium]|nr:AbrB/MazE/SpoVT family DNA-binding domain-containing protein [Candidatus Margulisiibacteriota bacterium]